MSPQDFMMLQYKVIGAKEVRVGPIVGKVSNTDMQVYWHLHTHYFGFIAQGKDCFIAQDTIGDALNISYKTVVRSLAVLEDIGLIAKSTQRLGPKKSRTTYAVLHYTLAQFDGKQLPGETPEVAFDDPLAFEEVDMNEDSIWTIVYGVKPKNIHWSEVDPKDVPY